MWKRILFLVVAGTLLLSCSTTYLGRYVSCGLTSNKDFEQFPTREIANGPDVFAFSDDAGARSQSLDRLEPIHYTFQGEARTAHLETLLEESGSSAFVVIQDDTILYEEYFNGYSRDSFNTSASVAKSFVSALIGIAIEEGLIGSVDDPIIQYLPELEDEGVDGVTIRQLLTMSSGFEHTWGLAPWHDLVRSYYSPDLSVGTASAPTTPEWAKRSVPQLKSGSSPPPTLCSWPPVHTEYRKLPVLMDSLFAIPERQAESLLVCRSTGSETLRRQHHGFSMRPALFNSLTCLTTQQRIINSLQPEAQMNRFRDPKRVVAFAIALATLQGCVSSTTSVSNSDIVVESGIVFATIDGVSLELDLARPARGRRPKPALVYLFGGGWISGTRGQFTDEIEEAARRGYVAISVDYRLTDVEVNGVPRYQFPTQVHDAKRAVRWLRDNAPMYSIDPDRIGAIGWSAGGHLALMLALTDATDGLEGESDVNAPSSRIQAAVALAGPTELAECYREYSGYLSKDTFFPRFLGGTPNQLPEQYLAASPTTYATSDDPPVLCIIGDHDTSVTERQGRLLQQRMQSVGASCEVVVVEGLMHGHLVVPAPPWEENIWRFLETNLSGR